MDLVAVVIPADPAVPAAQLHLKQALGVAPEGGLRIVVDLGIDTFLVSGELGERRERRVAQHIRRGVEHGGVVKEHLQRELLGFLPRFCVAIVVVCRLDRDMEPARLIQKQLCLLKTPKALQV